MPGASVLSRARTGAWPRPRRQRVWGQASSRFSRTDSAGTSVKRWKTMPMPFAIATAGEAMATGLPSSSSVPASG